MDALHDRYLERVRGEDRLYVLESVGTLKVHGWSWRSATAHADGCDWHMVRHGFRKVRWIFQATDAADVAVGSYEPCRRWRDGGVLCWDGRQLRLRPTSSMYYMYVLADGEHQLASFEHTGASRRPAVTVKDPTSLEPGLLLFAVFVIRRMLCYAEG